MHTSVVKAGMDISSFGALAAWWAGIAPGIATTLTVIWVSYCLVEAAYVMYHKFNKKDLRKKRNGSKK